MSDVQEGTKSCNRKEILIDCFREDTLDRWCATEVDADGVMVPVSFYKFFISQPKVLLDFSNLFSISAGQMGLVQAFLL